MKIRKPSFFFIILPLILTSSLLGQSPGERFVSGAARFAINMPADPSERKDSNFTLLGYDMNGESIRWEKGADSYTSVESYHVFGEKPELSELEKARIVEAYKKAALDQYKKIGLMTQEAPFELKGIKGAEIRAALAGKMVVRIFFVNVRLFTITVSRKSAPDFGPLLDIANSFYVLDKSEYSAALISENAPKELPQAPRPPRPANDLQENGLKGKVSKVVEKEQGSSKDPAELWNEQNFDAEGDLVGTISYLAGFPHHLARWGWVDKMRVKTEASISYGFGEGPNEKEMTVIQSFMESPSGPPPKRDERFDERHEYKYDAQNRIVEQKVFWNTGSLARTMKFEHKPNMRTSRYYDEQGEITYWSVEILDINGNVVEERSLDPNGKLESATVYQYEFDTKGNWTVRRSSEKKTVRGKTRLTAGAVHSREISYYP